jgi:photosystem II stability/assembly factor-like uncharacterized protein
VKKHRLFFLVCVCSIIQLCWHESAVAQWRKLHDFGGFISSVYFLDLPGAPRIGFVGVNDKTNGEQVWRTSDGGSTWSQTTTGPYLSRVWQFAFKDSLIGWFAATNHVYQTRDGGLTWLQTALSLSDYSSVYYNALNKRLFVSGDQGQDDYTSTDNGATWSRWTWGNPKGGSMTGYGGYDFGDALSGVVASIHDHDPCYYTTDGGVSWNESNVQNAAGAQPVAITGTRTYFLTEVFGSGLMRSRDGGKTWVNLLNFPSVTTTVLEGDGRMLAAQSNASSSSDGFYISLDSGVNWSNICGPSSGYGAIFYVKDLTIIAQDAATSLWINTIDPLHPGGEAPTIETDTIRLASVPCGSADRVVHYGQSANCQGFLTTISITGSQTIRTKNSPALPHPVSSLDSLVLTYTPSGATYDTAVVHLRFTNSTETFDTSIVVIAQALGSITSIGVYVPAASGAPGDTISIKPGFVVSPIVDVTLPFVYTVSFDASLLSPIPLSGTVQSGIRTITVYDTLVHGKPHSTALRFVVGLGDRDSTLLSPTQLSSGSACSINSSYGDGTFRLLNVCRSGNARLFDPSVSVSLSDPQPNPASQSARIDLKLAEAGPTTLQIFDALGRLVASPYAQTPTAGSSTVTLDLTHLAAGTYYYRLETPSQVFTKKMIVTK